MNIMKNISQIMLEYFREECLILINKILVHLGELKQLLKLKTELTQTIQVHILYWMMLIVTWLFRKFEGHVRYSFSKNYPFSEYIVQDPYVQLQCLPKHEERFHQDWNNDHQDSERTLRANIYWLPYYL